MLIQYRAAQDMVSLSKFSSESRLLALVHQNYWTSLAFCLESQISPEALFCYHEFWMLPVLGGIAIVTVMATVSGTVSCCTSSATTDAYNEVLV